jgi:SAM-dependent methyltransferase
MTVSKLDRLAPMADQTTPVAPQGDGDGGPAYGAYYFRHDCGMPYERNEHWLGFFGQVADRIIADLHPATVLDAGCAMGFLVEALVKRGVDATGIDVSEYAISQVHESVRDRCRVQTLTEPIEGRYDLITCIEVVEHIPPRDADTVLANLCAATDRLLLSSTPENYGEPTHLNVQPPEAWAAALAKHGFYRDVERDFSYLSPWAALYTRREEDVVETVRRYDRAWWRLQREVGETRAALIALQEQLERLEEEYGSERRPEALAELDKLREENLRLRDLLVGRDAELGAARGELAQHREQSQRLLNAAARIQSRIPGGMRLGEFALRKLQRRG